MPFKFSMKSIFLFLLVVMIATSCKKDKTLEHEIAKINTDVQIERFDKLFSKVTSNKLVDIKRAYPFMFSEKYPDSFWLAKAKDTLQINYLMKLIKCF